MQAATAAPNSTNSTGQSTGTTTTTPAPTTSTPTNTTTTSSVGAAACGVTKFTHKGGGFQNATFTMALHAEPPFGASRAAVSGVSCVVCSLISPLTVYYNPGAENAEDVYSGFTVEVARLLEIELACKFDFILGDEAEPEPAAGALAAIGSASGGAKARGDVAGGALHISVVPPPNSTRALHFSMPFYDSGYVMIIRAPILESNPWSFFSPFDYSLWVAVLVEMMLVAVACWLMEAPVCSIFRDTDVVDGFFHGLMDSMYWSITLLLQTPDKAPRTWGGKMVLVAHGWFMLIIIASYTANLASFLTAAEPVPILDSWQDVLKSNGRFKVAVPRGLSHENFVEVERLHFKEANNGLDPNLNIEWVSTWQEAFEHVRNGTVDATFHDEPVAQDYIIRMGWQCELLEVGKIFNSFGYGFAFSYDNTNFVAFSQAIVYLKERGYIDDLLRRFQIGPIDSGASESCSVAVSEDDPMTWYELQGLSVMVGAFILVGFVVNVVERLSFGRRIFTCLPKEDEERKGSEADVNSKFGATRFSRRHASQVANRLSLAPSVARPFLLCPCPLSRSLSLSLPPCPLPPCTLV